MPRLRGHPDPETALLASLQHHQRHPCSSSYTPTQYTAALSASTNIIIIRIQCINVVNQLLTDRYYLPLNQYLYLSSDYKLFYLYIFIHNKHYVRLTELLWYAALGLAAPIYYISVFHIHGKRVYIHENLPFCTTNTIGIGMDRRPASPLLNCKCSKRSLALNIYYIFCKILNQSLACLKCLLLLLHTLISLSISLSLSF